MPALDAVLFMNPRNSYVDVVQAVGRVMRKAEGEKTYDYGYIILPIAVPEGADPDKILDDNERFAALWSVLRALRSHDDRLDAEINKIDLNKVPTDRIIFSGVLADPGESQESLRLPLPPLNLPPGAIFAKIVEKCGDRKYWETWAKDVADIFSRLVHRINALLKNPDNKTLREWFEGFHKELKASINKSISADNVIDMVAQHILTQPVFDALFEGYDFAGSNPVARALDELQKDFGEFGLENEIRDLERFYESVRLRACGLDNSAARQRVLMELYEKFFATAMKKDASRLGIVYTPVEIVDFILNSVDVVLRKEFGRSLSDKDIHVLDPFTGTGIFLVRLLQSELIRDTDLHRKYKKELHANEIVLLAYYIAAVHIEEAFHGRIGSSAYKPFGGIVLTDTFNLHTKRIGFPKIWLPVNSERVERQQQQSIYVIVGNPPWRAGQKKLVDDNPNLDYRELRARVTKTYAYFSTARLKNSLYDTYKMAVRWASDRIGERGVIAFVTNGSWINGNADSGVRACLVKEFTSIYVLNLRGNKRTQGERSRREGGTVFGQSSRTPVAITILVRNPSARHKGCRILYRDIGDYLSSDNKLSMLRDWGSVSSIEDWEEITPDRHYDWIEKRDESFQLFYPMGSGAEKTDVAIFHMYSGGLKTARDAYLYNFSRDACAKNAQAMIIDYLSAVQELKDNATTPNVDNITRCYSSNIKWDQNLKKNMCLRKLIHYSSDRIWMTQYRPFVKQYCYVEYILVQRKSKQDSIFPSANNENLVICVPGVGSTNLFTPLMVNMIPDLGLIGSSQCFPRYRYENKKKQQSFKGMQPPERVDNITDSALRVFQTRYKDNTISKDSIFDYVYGILHSPKYRKRFANDLAKGLPRIPFAPDFHAFAKAGQALANLHLNYENCAEFPLRVEYSGSVKPSPEQFRLGKRAMRFAKDTDKTVLIINDHIRLTGIPSDAHKYEVNGRTPLEWFIDRYKITQDDQSGIVNDPNKWFHDPRDLVPAIRRIVYVSVESTRIIANLPEPFSEPIAKPKG